MAVLLKSATLKNKTVLPREEEEGCSAPSQPTGGHQPGWAKSFPKSWYLFGFSHIYENPDYKANFLSELQIKKSEF